MSKWERKFGKYAIPNLTAVLIICYVAGYLLQIFAPAFMEYLTLNPYAILHGQVWRLFTWIISPPTGIGPFVIIMLLFYYSLGSLLEQVWGTWKYNVYIFTGLFLSVVGSFIAMGAYYLLLGEIDPLIAGVWFGVQAHSFSTYYVNMSIFLACAAIFPDLEIRLMFVVSVKAKWLGILYGLVMAVDAFDMIESRAWFSAVAILASLLNFAIFFFRSKNHMHLNPRQIKRRAEFRQDVRKGTQARITKHKCAICGRSDEEDPSLEFRFCSKCNGNYEYCQHHLFTHQHVQ